MRTINWVVAFLAVLVLFAGCSGDTGRSKPAGSPNTDQKASPDKPAKPSEGS